MANILEFLRTVLVDDGAQRSFRDDPSGYLKEGGFGDLTGEDVAEAMNVLRRSLPEPVAAGLAPFVAPDGTEGVPPFRPVGVETELDAAARVLTFAVDECPAPTPSAQWTPPPPPADAPTATAPSGTERAVATAWAPPAADDASTPAWETPTPIYDADDEEPVTSAPEPPAPAVAEADAEWAPDQPTEPTEPTEQTEQTEQTGQSEPAEPAAADDAPAAGGSQSFGAALDSAVVAARQRHDDAIRQYTDESGRTTRELGQQLDALVAAAQSRAGDITSAAQASVTQLQEEAEARRRQGEEEARAIVERAQREADEVRAAARAEAEAAQQDIETRRAALRDAEEQLKEKFNGIDALFRQVLHDDQQPGRADPGGEQH